jgi:predicted RNA-binding protein with PUA-like domain
MACWLLKSEPETFGIGHLKRARGRRTGWDGVRNFQARNYLRDALKKGDQALFYHSSCEVPGIAGIVEVVREGYADATAFNPKDDHYDPKSTRDAPTWYTVDVRLVRELQRVITLEELRAHATGKLKDFKLLQRGNRLSVLPVSERDWRFILSLE